MGIGITQGSKSIIVFLSRSIPKGQFDVFSIYFNVCDVIFKDSGNVDLRGEKSQRISLKATIKTWRSRKEGSSGGRDGGEGDACDTSGKVPLEKTLRAEG